MTPDEDYDRALEAAVRRALEIDPSLDGERTADLLCEAFAAFQDAFWRPIETAPADGTRVLVFAPPSGNEYPAMVQRVDMWRSGGWWQMRPAQPYTHWRPLPAGPGDAP